MQGGIIKPDILYPDPSYRIVGILYEAYNNLGYGYKEKSYESAVAELFARNNIKYERQAPYKIRINGTIIERRYLDFIIEDKIILK